MTAVEIAKRILEKLPGLLECEDFIADDAIDIEELKPLCEAVAEAEPQIKILSGHGNFGIEKEASDWLTKHAGDT